MKRHYTTVEFFQGTMMNAVDLERVKVHPFKSYFRLQTSKKKKKINSFFVVQVYTVYILDILLTILNIQHAKAAKFPPNNKKKLIFNALACTHKENKKTTKKWNFEHYQPSIHRTVKSTHFLNNSFKV